MSEPPRSSQSRPAGESQVSGSVTNQSSSPNHFSAVYSYQALRSPPLQTACSASVLITEEPKQSSKGLPARRLRIVLRLVTRLPTFLSSSPLHPFSRASITSASFYWCVLQPQHRNRGCNPSCLCPDARQSCPPLLAPLKTASLRLPPPSSPPSPALRPARARMPARSRPATSDGSSFPSTSEYLATPDRHARRGERAVSRVSSFARALCVWSGAGCGNDARPHAMIGTLTHAQQLREQAAPSSPLLLQQAVHLHPRRGGR